MIIIKTIHTFATHNGDYTPNFEGIFAPLGKPNEPLSDIRVLLAQNIQSVFDIVATRLSDPKSREERHLVDEFPDRIQKWVQRKVKVPALEHLPTPSLEMYKALDEVSLVLKKMRSYYDEDGRVINREAAEHFIALARSGLNQYAAEVISKDIHRPDDPKPEPL